MRAAPRALTRDLGASAAPKSSTLILVGVAGAFAGLALLYADRPFGWDEDALKVARKPEFLTWAFLVCAQMASWFVGAVFVVRTLGHVWDHRHGRAREIWGSAVLLTALMATFVAISRTHAVDYDFAFPHDQAKTFVLTLIAFPIAMAAAIGMWLVHAALEDEFNRTPTPDADQVKRFVELRERLQLLLTILGAILGGAILGSGALRNAILASDVGANFPPESVLVYGAFLSGLVALAYAPTHARVLTLGRQLRDRMLPPPATSAPGDWVEWHSNRKALDELLGLNVSTAASLRTGAAILTPLAGSLVGLLLGTS